MGRIREDNRQRRNAGRWKAWIPAVLIPLFLAIVLGGVWDYYYDLNDDALMKQILAGEFTGEPEIRNIQSLFPLSAFLGELYRIFHGTDIYGIFLLVLQFGCFGILLVRSGEFAVSVLMVLMYLGLTLYHLVFLQYSFTVGMMGTTAAFLFLLMRDRKGEGIGAWVRELLPSLLLIWIGFLLRSEMMLFMAPFIGLAFLFRLFDLDATRARKWKILIATTGLVLAGLCAGWAGDQAGYSGSEWKEFRGLFDARTELYDFERIPSFEENAAFYQEIGLDSSEVKLIENYNYGIDDRIDAEVLQSIADYADTRRYAEVSAKQRLVNAFWDLRHSWQTEENQPYLPLIIILSVLDGAVILFRGLAGKRRKVRRTILRLLELAAMISVSSGLLLYLYYNERPVVRLTHSIYMAETMILVWMLWRELKGGEWNDAGRELPVPAGNTVSRNRDSEEKIQKSAARQAEPHACHGRRTTRSAVIIWIALCICAAAACAVQIRMTQEEEKARIAKNTAYNDVFIPYLSDHPGNMYYTDVYSTVNFSDRVFGEQAVPVNWDLMGGWASKSPLELKKLKKLGMDQAVSGDADAENAADDTSLIMQESLLYLENCYVAAEAGEDMQWLTDYYAFRGTKIRMIKEDEIGTGNGTGSGWVIWKVQEEHGG